MTERKHAVLEEGTDAGILGATAVVIWYFILDLLAGKPLATPSILGQLVILGDRTPNTEVLVPKAIAWYTFFHFFLFAIFGTVVAWLVKRCVHQDIFRFALLMLFVVFEVFFYGVITALSANRELFPLWSVLVANLLATLVMGTYFWRKHPDWRSALMREPLGAGDSDALRNEQ